MQRIDPLRVECSAGVHPCAWRGLELTTALTEEPFKLLVQSVIDYAIYMLDPNGRVTSWNAGAERIKGFQRRRDRRRAFFDLLHR